MNSAHLLAVSQRTGIPMAYWIALRDDQTRERVVPSPAKPSGIQPADFLTDETGNILPWPAPNTPIGLSEAARKYGVPHPTLSRWAKRGEIAILRRPEKNGLPMELDERSIYDAVRWKKLNPDQGQNPLAARRHENHENSPPPSTPPVRLAS